MRSLSNIADQYYIQNNYGSCILVFDGYRNGASTKDHEHRLRNKGMAFPYVKIELGMVAHNKQNDFSSNKLNNSQFISHFLETIFKRKALISIKALTMQKH